MLDIVDRRNIIHEHFGEMDNTEYEKSFIEKIRDYAKSGYFIGDNLIVTFEDSRHPFNDKLFEEQLVASGITAIWSIGSAAALV